MIRARDDVDVDALSDGRVLVVLSEELREFDVIDSDSTRGGRHSKNPSRDTAIGVLMCKPLLLRSPPMSGLCIAQVCLNSIFEELYCSFLLLLALQSQGCHNCPISANNWSRCVSFFGLGQSSTMPSPWCDLCTHLPTFIL